MLRRVIALLLAAGGITVVAVCKVERFRAGPSPSPRESVEAISLSASGDCIGKPLYPPVPFPTSSLPRPSGMADPIVIPDCRLTVIDRQDVPSQRDGVLLHVATEVEAGQDLPADQLITVRIGNQTRQLRRLKEGDEVKAGQLLGILDDQLSRDDWAIKQARVVSGRADLEAAVKTCEEARNRLDTQLRLLHEGRGATAEEEVRAARLAWDRAACEVVSKREAVTLAERELSQADTILRMHQIRSSTSGVLKAILKKPGEAVKAYEPLFQIHNLSRLRIEGSVDVQYLPRLSSRGPVTVELSQPEAPRQTLIGHLQAVTAVAVSKDIRNPRIVSASQDGTVRVWDLAQQREQRIVPHPVAVLAVACTPAGASANLCLSGAADGKARLWDLDRQDSTPRELHGQHDGAVTCVAFSPDGRSCVSGGEDREILLWDTTTGALRYRFPAGHRGTVTAVQFTPRSQLVSVGHDLTVRLWTLGEQGARLEATYDRRSGSVSQLGASPNGGHVLYDQGNTLRLLSLPGGLTEATVASSSAAGSFSTFALFSPDGSWILTADAHAGRARLWRTPTASRRATELRQLVAAEPLAVTCAAWAPDGSFVAIGARDCQVRIWPIPSPGASKPLPTAEVTLIERAVESSTRQVRLWAELPNSDGRLLPGTTVTLVLE